MKSNDNNSLTPPVKRAKLYLVKPEVRMLKQIKVKKISKKAYDLAVSLGITVIFV